MKNYKKSRMKAGLLLCLTTVVLGLNGCNSNSKKDETSSTPATETDSGSVNDVKPTGAKPEWAASIEPQMQAVIEKLASYGAKPIPDLTPQQARQNPTPTTAVMDIIQEKNIPVPAPQVDTTGQQIPTTGGKTIHARIYTPKTGTAPFPVIVYFHGGGWVIADLDTYNASAQGLAEQVGAVVVSVAYRLAPENKFPAAHEDAFAAYEWVLKNAASIKGDAKRVAVAGESAGGNLAANVSIMARDKKVALPAHQLLVYPVANNDMMDASYTQYAMAKPLDKLMMEWFVKHALKDKAQSADPRISLAKANLKGLPPTTLIAAEIDPLQTEGKLLADKLEAAGVKVDYKLYKGVTHEFFGMALVVPEAKDAQGYAADELKKAFKP